MNQIAVTIATISLSSVMGAAMILLLRAIHRRRRLFTSIHGELIENYTHVTHLIDHLEEGKHLYMVFPPGGFHTSALSAARIRDPALYISLCEEVDGIWPSQNLVEMLNESINASNRFDPELREQDVQGFSEGTLETGMEAFENTKSELHQAIYGMREYRSSTWTRRILYFGCIKDEIGDELEDSE